MNFEIELKPHVGEMMSGGKLVEVEFDQFQIFVTGEDLEKVRGKKAELIGYVGKRIGSPINYLKVVLAFGQPTVKVFTRMIKAALIDVAKQRVAEAITSSEESKKLLVEVEALAEQEKQMVVAESQAKLAKQLADDAIEAANRELLDAQEILKQEQEASRKENEPDPSILADMTAPKIANDNGLADQANLQNL
jgi:hypothetical protein